MILVYAADLGTTIPFVMVGFIYLHFRGHLTVYAAVGSAAFVLIVLFLVGALWLARVRRIRMQAFLRWIERLVNALGGHLRNLNLLADDRPRRNAEQFAHSATAT